MFSGMGTAAYPRMHFMWQSLRDLDNQFREHGGRLYIFQGQPKDVFEKLIKVSDSYIVSVIWINPNSAKLLKWGRRKTEAYILRLQNRCTMVGRHSSRYKCVLLQGWSFHVGHFSASFVHPTHPPTTPTPRDRRGDLNFGQEYRKKLGKGVGVGRKNWAGVGGLHPGVGATDPPPPPPPPPPLPLSSPTTLSLFWHPLCMDDLLCLPNLSKKCVFQGSHTGRLSSYSTVRVSGFMRSG